MLLPRRNRIRVLAAAGLLMMLLAALTGCANGKFRKIQPDKQVLDTFLSYQMLPDHKYDYRGVASSPSVVAGINQDFVMNLRMWAAIDTDSGDFKTLVDRISFRGMGNNAEPWGLIILDHQGNRVGVWYSALRGAAIEVNENRQITSLTPFSTLQSARSVSRKKRGTLTRPGIPYLNFSKHLLSDVNTKST